MSIKIACLLLLACTAVFTAPLDDHQHDEEYKCIHDELDHDFQFLDVEEDRSFVSQENGRVLASLPNIRMYPYYTTLLKTSTAAYSNYIQKQLVPAVLSYLQAALKIKYPLKDKLKISTSMKTMCGVATPPVLFTGVATDYFLVFQSESNAENWVANSGPCFLATDTNRPLIARITFNRRLLKPSNGNAVIEERNAYLLMHELIHSLGFSKSLFPYFLDENGKPRKGHIKTVNLLGSMRTVINVPKLTTKLRNYFGCANLEGAYLENNGGAGTAGSHFERRHFVFDTMASGVVHGRKVTQFTLGMLEASGWYEPDYDYVEPYFFGQGQGCGFLKTSCASPSFKFEEFCKGSGRGCAEHGRGGGVCSSDPSSDGCKYYVPQINYDCEDTDSAKFATLPNLQVFGRGSGSRCFSGDLTAAKSASETSFCFKYTCEGSGSSTVLQVLVGKQKVTCKKEGQAKVPGYNGSINCPDPLHFCSTIGKPYCPRNCMGRGTCKNNVCVCKKGFKGIDCGLNA